MLAGGLVFINGSADIETKYQGIQIHYVAHRYLIGIIIEQVGQINVLTSDNVPAGQRSGLLSSEEEERDVSVVDH